MTINWVAVGAIGGILGSIATFSAVVVALWQTRIQNEKKLSLKFSPTVIGVGLMDDGHDEFISLDVINIGNRKCTISEWGFYLLKKERAMVFPNKMPSFSDKLPKELEPEGRVDLLMDRALFVQSLKNCIEQRKIKKGTKLRFYAKDTSGKFYKVKTNIKVKEYL